MEFLPVLDPLDKPKKGIWYSLTPRGDAPGVSVGHTCTFIPSTDGGKGRIYIVGGANPSSSYSHSHIINLDNHEWDIPEWKGLEQRYEHCCFVVESCPESLWVFGGAQQSGNRNCIQNLQPTESGSCWKNVSSNGKPPSPRTYHTSSACIGDRLFVFSGGEAGAAPVSDPQLHVFDSEVGGFVTILLHIQSNSVASRTTVHKMNGSSLSIFKQATACMTSVSCSWSQPETQGRPPTARHGHIVVAVGTKIFFHGGMAGDKFHNDMYSLDTRSMRWEKVLTKGDIPQGVASHSAVALGRNIYVFGGMTANGASNSMYRFTTGKNRWVLINFEGDKPPNRLDHSMCLLPWKLCVDGNENEQSAHSAAASETLNLAFVFGGMDTQGIIHNDCVVTVVT